MFEKTDAISAPVLAAVGFEENCVIWGYIPHAESGTLNITFHFQQAVEVGKGKSGRKKGNLVSPDPNIP